MPDLLTCQDENETARCYCRRLAAIVILPDYIESFRNALTPQERIEILKKPVSAEDLAKRLQMSPRLQSMVASCTSYTPSVWLLEQELIARGKRDERCRKHADSPDAVCDATALDIYRVAQGADSTGLCFSGGGIRSATFNLGILQGLAKLDLLDKFDYLSTVSGGGYIHQFLAAWLYNRNCLQSDDEATTEVAAAGSQAATPEGALSQPTSGTPAAARSMPALSSTAASATKAPAAEVQNQLKPLPWELAGSASAMTEQPEPLRWLRRFSNYLTPNKGLFTTDTWVMVAIWMRNTFLNQLALVSLLGTILLVPHLVRWIGECNIWHALYKWPHPQTGMAARYALPGVLMAALGAAACWLVISVLSIARQGRMDPDRAVGNEQSCSPAPKADSGGHRHSTASKEAQSKAKAEDWSDRSGAGRWMWLLGLLTCIAVIVSPAVYEASFVPAETARIAFQKSCTPGASAPNCVTATETNASKEKAQVGRGLPDFEMRKSLSGNEGNLGWRIGKWFGHYSYPLWLNRSDSGFYVEMAFLLFTFAFCLSSGFASLGSRPGLGGLWCIVGSVVGTATTWGALYVIRLLVFLFCFWKPAEVPQLAIVLLPMSVLSAFFLALVLTAGVIGRRTDDSLREAMARLRALAFLMSFVWVGISGFSLVGSFLFKALVGTSAGHWPHWKQWATILGWAGGTLGGVMAGNSDKSSGRDEDSLIMKVLVKAGPPIFIIGILLLLAQLLQMMVGGREGYHTLRVIWIFLGFLLSALLFGFRLDINDFSMHAFYRDRLARCYAGASYPKRRPNRFTGFAQSDGRIRVADLLPEKFQKGDSAGISQKTTAITTAGSAAKPYPGPFPIFCTTVNLTFGQDLAWQERKAASFAFTPLYSGYSPGWTSDNSVVKEKKRHSYNGFVSTRKFAYESGGIAMHSAVAISGAAVSPSMGYHSDPAMAFLLTMFNVRLGWWIKNPRVSSLIQLVNSPSPPFPLWNLFNELLGHATDMSHYVYLTDGGHFDNMGLYELVRRRCRRILICDAEQDGSNVFDGIGSAIRKCRVDFGVEVDLDLGKLDPGLVPSDSAPRRPTAPVHFVQGTIKYPEDDEKGTVIYIKSRVTGDEPGDILNYNRQHAGFPNETTLNQWFTESQFESYRRLGYHSILDGPQTLETDVPVTVAIQPAVHPPGASSTATLSVASLPLPPEKPLRDILQNLFSAKKKRESGRWEQAT